VATSKRQRSELENPQLDEVAVGEALRKLREELASNREKTAAEVARCIEATTRVREKLDDIDKRFGDLRSEWERERAAGRAGKRKLDDDILAIGKTHQEAKRDIEGVREQLALIKMPDAILAPFRTKLGEIQDEVLAIGNSVRERDARLRKEIARAVPAFRNKGRVDQAILDEQAREAPANPGFKFE
jgi:septation ring formation regulator EzrA